MITIVTRLVITKNNFNELRRREEEASSDAVAQCAILTCQEAQRLLDKQADGPSAPGEPPHKHTGGLQASLYVKIVDRFHAIVTCAADHWWFVVHEFGGKHHPKRPFLRPALANCKKWFPELFARAFSKRIRG